MFGGLFGGGGKSEPDNGKKPEEIIPLPDSPPPGAPGGPGGGGGNKKPPPSSGARPAPRGGGGATPPKNLSYAQMKDAVETEHKLMELMLRLNEQEFNQLMTASAEFSRAMQQQMQVGMESAKIRAREAEARAREEAAKQQTEQKKLGNEAKKDENQQRLHRDKEMEKVRTEEKKRLIDYQVKRETEAQQERYKRKIEAKRELEKLETERIEREAREKEEDFQRAMKLASFKAEQKEKHRRESEVELAPFRLEQELQRRQLLGEELLEEELAKVRVRNEAEVAKERLRVEAASDFFRGEKGRERLWNLGLFAGGVLGALYAYRTLQPLAAEGLRRLLFKPSLVSTSFRNSAFARAKRAVVARLPSVTGRAWRQQHPELVLSPQLRSRLEAVASATHSTAHRRGIFGNLLLYGPPGTGKTLFAQTLAERSKMDFALMSGPAFMQFEAKDAIQEVKKLFKWAGRSRRGLLLFIDEADSFLAHRNTLDHRAAAVLNEWLAQTGTESRKFMCVYSTNRDEVLDPAVQSRVAVSIEMARPGVPELHRLLAQYLDLYVVQEMQRFGSALFHQEDHKSLEFLDLERTAARLHLAGFAGRDVSNLAIATAQALYSHEEMKLTKELFDTVVAQQLEKRERERANEGKLLQQLPLN